MSHVIRDSAFLMSFACTACAECRSRNSLTPGPSQTVAQFAFHVTLHSLSPWLKAKKISPPCRYQTGSLTRFAKSLVDSQFPNPSRTEARWLTLRLD